MAINITYQFQSEDRTSLTEPIVILACNVPNFILWEKDSISAGVLYGEITDGVNTFTKLYPNDNGVCSFDLSIFGRNQQKWKELDLRQYSLESFSFWFNIEPDSYRDVTLSEFTLKLYYDNDTDESIEIEPIRFIQAVRQNKTWQRGDMYQYTLVEDWFLIPDNRDENGIHQVRIWNGLPFDLSFFKYGFDEDGNYLANFYFDDVLQATGYDATSINILQYVTLNDGSKNYDDIGLTSGQTLRVELYREGGDGYNTRDLVTKLIIGEKSCGKYFRFMNSNGGWSYWLFTNPTVESEGVMRSQLFDKFSTDPLVEDTNFDLLHDGFEESQTVKAQFLQDWEYSIVKEILTSPYVYVYNFDSYELFYNDKRPLAWSRCRIINGIVTASKSSAITKQVQFTYQTSVKYFNE